MNDSTTDSDTTIGPKTPIGPGIQEKVDIFDNKDKRKAETSPEQELSKKDKKRIKEQDKAQRKQEYRDRKQLSLQQK